MTYGKMLKKIMEKRGMSITELSKRTGISYTAIAKYLDEEMTPTLPSAAAIAKELNVSLDLMVSTEKMGPSDVAFKKVMAMVNSYFDDWTYDQKVKIIKSIL